MWSLIHALHVGAFLGCLVSSGWKLRILSGPSLDGIALQHLRRLDIASSSSTGVILLTGATMLFAQPGRLAHLGDPAFQAKLLLFILASGLVLASKAFLRRRSLAGAEATMPTPGWLRMALAVDFGSILIIAGLGLAVAHGAV